MEGLLSPVKQMELGVDLSQLVIVRNKCCICCDKIMIEVIIRIVDSMITEIMIIWFSSMFM